MHMTAASHLNMSIKDGAAQTFENLCGAENNYAHTHTPHTTDTNTLLRIIYAIPLNCSTQIMKRRPWNRYAWYYPKKKYKNLYFS